MYAPDVTRLRDAMNRKQHLTLADLKADPGFWLTQSKVKPQPYAATVEALRRIPQSVSPHDALLAAGMTSPARRRQSPARVLTCACRIGLLR